MRKPVLLLGVSASAGAAVHGVSGDAHADYDVLSVAVEHVPAVGHEVVAEVAEVLEQPGELAERRLELWCWKLKQLRLFSAE